MEDENDSIEDIDDERKENEGKEVIELNLEVSGQMSSDTLDDFGKALTESEDEGDQATEKVEDGREKVPSSHDDDKVPSIVYSEVESDADDLRKLKSLSVLSIRRLDNESLLDYNEYRVVSLSGELDKGSMINTLFTKSDSHIEQESNEVQVTIFLPDNQSMTKFYHANTNIYELKRDIGGEIGQDADKIWLSLLGNSSGDYLGDWTPLVGIPPNSVGGLILNLSFKYDIELKSSANFPSVETYAPIITVRQVKVVDSVGREKYVAVVTEDISYVKKWLGGFRNIKTGQIYHNASTETRYWDKKPKVERNIELNSRVAQTHLPYLTKHTQIDANKATQMWRPDHYIQSEADKVLTARPYTEYDLRNEQQEKLQSAIKIQRWYRRMVSKRNVRKAFTMLIDLIKKQREKRSAAEKAKHAEQIQRLIAVSFPTLRNDFYYLYSMISLWWRKEYNEISKITSISERRAAYYDLLQEEIELFFAVEKQSIKSRNEALARRNMKLIEETSRSIIRHQRKGNMTIVDTLEIQRAREIKEVFMTYKRNDLSKEDRINVLLSISSIVETFEEIDYTKDLLELLRREVNLISMGIDENYLKGLRKRIEEGILHFFRDEHFNPQVKNFRPIHFGRVNQRSHRCKGCRKLKTPADFPIHVRLRSYWDCRSCNWLKITSHSVLNIYPYANILKFLRAREITKCPRSTYCFILQPFGAYTIINTIWNGKSALSESMFLPTLRLCRWDNKQEWSPWNTILLTAEEAEVHERILNNEDVYEAEFIQSVKLKHISTKFEFKVMDETDIHCRETGLWDSALDENIYQHMFHRREALQFEDPTFKLPYKKAFVPSEHETKIPPCKH